MEGPVKIATQYDLLHEGIIEAGNGIILTSENSPILFKESQLITPNKTIIIESNCKFSQEQLVGISDEHSHWQSESVQLKTLETDIKLHSTSVASGLLIVSGAHAQIHGLWQKALKEGGGVHIAAASSVEMSDCILHGKFHVPNSNEVWIDNCYTQSERQSVSLNSSGRVALRQFHVRQAEEVSFQGPEMIVKQSTLEIEQTLKADGGILDLENVSAFVKEKKIEIQGVDVKLKDARLMSKGTQRIKGHAVDLENVVQVTVEGSLKLKSKELGYYKDSQFFALAKSIEFHSKAALSLQKISAVAKGEIQQFANTILSDEDSTYWADAKLTQRAFEIHSTNSHLQGNGLIAMIAHLVNALSLKVTTSQTFDVISEKEAFLYQAILKGKIRISVVSFDQNVFLNEASMASSELSVDANTQVQMQNAILTEGKGSSVFSQIGWIEAQGSKIEAAETLKSEEAKILFQAEEGAVHLDRHKLKAKAPVHVRAQSAQIDQISLDTEKGISFESDSVHGHSGKLKSDQSHISIEGADSIFLENFQKIAPQGNIKESSQGWIIEKGNENQAQEIQRRSNEMQIADTDDQAEKIRNEAVERLTLSEYRVKAFEEVALISDGKSSLVESDIKTPHLDVRSDALWMDRDKFYANEFQARARDLQMQMSETVGQISTFDARTGTLSLQKNLLNSQFNRLLGKEQIVFKENTSSGSMAAASSGPQFVHSNTFVDGDLHFKSAHESVRLQTNNMEDAGTVVIEAPEGEANIRDIHAQVDSFTAAAQEVSIQIGEILSEKNIDVKGFQQVEMAHSQLTGKESLKIGGIEEDPLLEVDLRKVELKGLEIAVEASKGNVIAANGGDRKFKQKVPTSILKIVIPKGAMSLNKSGILAV